MKASLICIYNNEDQLHEQLMASPALCNMEIEFILINNKNGDFSSAAKALNYGAKKSTTNILIFVHQDVYIKEKDGLSSFIRVIRNGKIGEIYGSSGAVETQKKNIGLYTTGSKLDPTILKREWKLKKVSCVDECLFGMRRETYELHPFDEYICDNWHLYCVEQCLFQRKNGNNIYVYPIQIHHFSKGKISIQYMKGLNRLAEKYRYSFSYIWTTAYKVRTNKMYMKLLLFFWQTNRKFICPIKNKIYSYCFIWNNKKLKAH